jgi:hypothetical protein
MSSCDPFSGANRTNTIVEHAPTPHSTFIDGLAWTTLVVSVLVIPMSLLMMLASSGPTTDVREMLAVSGFDVAVPNSIVFVFKHLRWISLSLFVLSVFSVVSSLALLKRRNWARLAFIWMLVLNIGLNVVGVAVAFFSKSPPTLANGLPAAAQAQVEWTVRLAMGINGILIIALSVAMAWMVKRLLSSDIKREFRG